MARRKKISEPVGLVTLLLLVLLAPVVVAAKLLLGLAGFAVKEGTRGAKRQNAAEKGWRTRNG